MSEPRVIAVAHGKSEIVLIKWLMSRTGINMIIDSNDGGNRAIRIENLTEWFSQKCYSCERELHRRFGQLEYRPGSRDPMPRLRIFVLMDTEGKACARPYISGDMFAKCHFREKIVPIYCDPELESVLESTGFAKSGFDKTDRLSETLLSLEPADLYAIVKDSKRTNLGVFIKYCLDTRPSNQNRKGL